MKKINILNEIADNIYWAELPSGELVIIIGGGNTALLSIDSDDEYDLHEISPSKTGVRRFVGCRKIGEIKIKKIVERPK